MRYAATSAVKCRSSSLTDNLLPASTEAPIACVRARLGVATPRFCRHFLSGANRDQTGDLLLAKHLLSDGVVPGKAGIMNRPGCPVAFQKTGDSGHSVRIRALDFARCPIKLTGSWCAFTVRCRGQTRRRIVSGRRGVSPGKPGYEPRRDRSYAVHPPPRHCTGGGVVLRLGARRLGAVVHLFRIQPY